MANGRAQAAITLSVDAAAASCVAALSAAGVDSVLLKGPAIAHWLGSPRSYGDVDLLVPPDQFEEAVTTALKLGYTDLFPDPAERLRLEPQHARTLVPVAVAARGAPAMPAWNLDLHSSFHGVGAAPERFWDVVSRGSAEIQAFDTRLRIPGRDAIALIIGIHAGRPNNAPTRPGESPQAAVDLERAIEILPIGAWRAAAALAGELGATEHLAIGLRTSRAGSSLADDLGLPSGNDLRMTLFETGAPGMSHALQRLSEKRGIANRAAILGRALLPTPGYMRGWSPLATRGPLGLAAAYAWRPFSLLTRLPRSALALRRARRETAARAK